MICVRMHELLAAALASPSPVLINCSSHHMCICRASACLCFQPPGWLEITTATDSHVLSAAARTPSVWCLHSLHCALLCLLLTAASTQMATSTHPRSPEACCGTRLSASVYVARPGYTVCTLQCVQRDACCHVPNRGILSQA